MSYDIRIFKGGTADQYTAALMRAANRLNCYLESVPIPNPQESKPGEIRTRSDGDVHSLFIQTDVAKEFEPYVASEFSTISLDLSLYDADVWYYGLFDGTDPIDKFCTNPEYFGEDDDYIRESRGDPEKLARVWNLPIETVKKFVRHIGEGDSVDVQDDFFEFMKALGANEPIWVTYRLTAVVPPNSARGTTK